MTTRRSLIRGAAGFAAMAFQPRIASAAEPDDVAARLAHIEARLGGRLGVCLIDTATGTVAGRRLDERFPMCSTFKMLAAAAILARVDAGLERLDTHVAYSPDELPDGSPVTREQLGKGLSVEVLCEAAVTRSDNGAANLLLARLGGPSGLTGYLRTLGDAVTRLDRTEPTLNESRPGDARDTTTPRAMADDIRRLVVGTALSAPSRARISGWLVGNRTGDQRLRAGLPSGWMAGEKTGTGPNGTNNDVGIAWPPGHAPLILASFITGAYAGRDAQDAAHANVARLAASRFTG
ncbi:class A beta-lactamase [Ancylobacter lacus]|uniref:class A beta-lactamase n=1 Tax=Ancylobacter lacus TaxID=2579970 RepID=UPI001BCD65EF|nr:class A beta-lactamase [Ancylobacter lacus]MBS7539899.1 class A beta-lactamase [Ancylobacter lacus]